MNWSRYIVYFLFGGFGAVLFIAGLVDMFKTWRFVAGASRSIGTVVAHETQIYTPSDDDNSGLAGTYYNPIFEFEDAKGILHRVTSSTGASRRLFAKGTRVRVLFDAEDPKLAEIETFGRIWGGTAFLLGGGALFLFAGIASWIFNVSFG